MTLRSETEYIEYGKKFADIGFSLGDSPRILVQRTIGSSGRNRMRNLPLRVKKICDITGNPTKTH